jgi:chromosome segregation ATPase
MSFRAPDPKGKEAAQERRRQLEEWKARRASQGAGRTSLGGGARQPFDSRRGSLSSFASARNSTTTPKTGTTSRLRRSFAGATPASAEQSTSGRTSSSVRAPLAPENGSVRRKSAALGARGSASKSTEKPKSSGKKATVTRATPSPPAVGSRGIAHQHDIYPTTHDEKSPPSAGATKLVPSPDAVSAFMASLRGGAGAHHSPGVARSRPISVSHESPPEVTTPKSGVSHHRPNAAAVAAFALSRSGLLSRASDSPPGPMQTLPDSGGKAAALEAARAAREAHAAAAAKAAELEAKLQAAESEKHKLQSDVASLGAQMGSLQATSEAQRLEAQRARAEAAEAARALEAAKAAEAAAVEEREFTIEAQAGMLQQLSGELERAEKSRDEAERSKAAREEKVLKVQAEFDRTAAELAQKNHQLHQMQLDAGGGFDSARRESLGGGIGRYSLGDSGRRSSVYSAGRPSMSHADAEQLRAAENVARQSQERLLELVAARQAAERDAADARAAAKQWETEVGQRRADLEIMQEELEGCLEEERAERRKAEEEYAKARAKSENLERVVEQRAEEIYALEEKLTAATAATEQMKASCEERDALLRDGAAVLEQKEAELDDAAEYALQLQQQLQAAQAEREEARANGTPRKNVARMEAKEAEIREIKAEHESAMANASREVETLKLQLVERDASLAEASRELRAREGERSRLESEVAARGAALSPVRGQLESTRATLATMRAELDSRDAQLVTVSAQLRQAMSAEKKQTERMRRLEMSLTEREEMVRNMDAQLKAAEETAKSAATAVAERDQFSSLLTQSEATMRDLEARLAAGEANHGELRAAQQAEAAARARAEALAAEVAKEETRTARLVEELATAEDAAEMERERRAQVEAEAQEAAAQAAAANMERVAELEGAMLQIQTEADQRVEEAESRVATEEAERRLADAEAALAAAREELESHKLELAAAHETLAATDSDRRRRKSLEAHQLDARRAVAEAENRASEARLAFAEAESRCAELETQVVKLAADLEGERKHTKLSMETAAKLHLQKEDAANALRAALEAKLSAAEAAEAASRREAERLAGELDELKGDANLQAQRNEGYDEELMRMEEELAEADEKVAAALAEADDAKAKADEVEKESLNFLGEMSAAIADAEKKIAALHKTVASRDMKLSQVTGEVKALKNALREREDKLASLERDQKDAYDAKLALVRKTHAEELASAKGEVEGQNVMLEMENQQLVASLEEKRAKIKSLQAELSRAVAKSKQLKDQSEMAKAAKTIAEEGRAEAEKALRRGTGGQPFAADARLEARIDVLEKELADTKASAAALGRAMWEHGMRPKDLDADAAAALEAFAGPVAVAHAAALGTPKSKILEMTEAAGKISFSKIRAGVERRKAEIKRRSSLGLDNASTELASLRATIATMMESSAKKHPAAGSDETPAPQRPTSSRHSLSRMTFGESPSPAPPRRASAAPLPSVPTDAENAPPKEAAASKSRDSIGSATSIGSKGSRRESARMATRRKALRSLQSHSAAAR